MKKQIKIFIDESGNTGQIKISIKNNKFNYEEQRYITLGMLYLNSIKIKNNFIEKYKSFKNKFHINDELKGTDLLIKDNNDKLEYLLKNIINKNFFAISLDKKFFVCVEILHLIYGLNREFAILKQLISSFLVNEDDEFFSQYILLLENPIEKQLYNFLNFLVKYNYKKTFETKYKENLIQKCISLLENKNYLKIIENIQKPLINKKGKKYYHVPNFDLIFHGLDTIFNFQENLFKMEEAEIILYHHNIEELEFYIKEKFNLLKSFSEISNIQFKLKFLNSNDLLIQLIDNFTSVFNKLIKTILTEENIDLSFKKNLWSFKKLAFLTKKIGLNNLNSFFSPKNKALIETLFNLSENNENSFNIQNIKNSIINLEKLQLDYYYNLIKKSLLLDWLNIDDN